MTFYVTRSAKSLVSPSEPTPSDTLELSSLDRVPGLRHTVRSLHVFKNGEQPAKVIREALSKALVRYYPFAGRFVESDKGEVSVACTGEGVWFVEATAECSLEDVKYLDHPLMISQEELLPEPSSEIDPIDLPIMMQVTEFTCGGFVVGIMAVHTTTDGLGFAQFLNTVAELARGHPHPTINPIWSRHLIPSPPKLPPGPPPVFPSFKLQYYTVDLPLDYINHLKTLYLHTNGHHCSTFDISIAKAWQSRTRAINLDPDTPVHVCFFANTRHLLTPQVLPQEGGYYGNCFYPVTVTALSGTVAKAELVEVISLIRDAKVRLPGEFAQWTVGDFKKDPYDVSFTYNSLFVSDWTRLGLFEVDYGWGKPVHIIPFAYNDFMAVAILGAPPSSKKGVRVMTQCVENEHLLTFQAQMKSL